MHCTTTTHTHIYKVNAHTCVYSKLRQVFKLLLRLLLLLLLCRRIRTRKVVSKRVSLPALPFRCTNLLGFTFFVVVVVVVVFFSTSQRRARVTHSQSQRKKKLLFRLLLFQKDTRMWVMYEVSRNRRSTSAFASDFKSACLKLLDRVEGAEQGERERERAEQLAARQTTRDNCRQRLRLRLRYCCLRVWLPLLFLPCLPCPQVDALERAKFIK